MELSAEMLTAFGRQLRADVLRTHELDSCIYTTASTVNVMRRLGHDAYALSVRTVLMNAAMARLVDENGGNWVDKDDPAVLAAGGFAIGIGYASGEMEGRWPGHLVAIVDRRWLLDFSIDQASRPQYGLTLDDVLAGPVTEDLLRARGRGIYELRSDEGALMRAEYVAYPGDRTYRTSPDWQRGIEREVDVRFER